MYEPKVDDYVVWTTALGMVHEGWVYYVAEPSKPKRGWKKHLKIHNHRDRHKTETILHVGK